MLKFITRNEASLVLLELTFFGDADLLSVDNDFESVLALGLLDFDHVVQADQFHFLQGHF